MWTKINKLDERDPSCSRRDGACVSRSKKRPDVAYMMMPKDWARHDRVSILHDGKNRIALDFDPAGDYAVRKTSKTSYTVKITIPKSLSHLIPFGLTDVELRREEDYLVVTL